MRKIFVLFILLAGCAIPYTSLNKNIKVAILSERSGKRIYLKIKTTKKMKLLVKCRVEKRRDVREIVVDKETELIYKIFQPMANYRFKCKYYQVGK